MAVLEATAVRFCTKKPESVAVCLGLARLFVRDGPWLYKNAALPLPPVRYPISALTSGWRLTSNVILASHGGYARSSYGPTGRSSPG